MRRRAVLGLRLAVREIGAAPWRTAATFVALAAALTLVLTVVAIQASVAGSADRLTELAGPSSFEVVATTPDGFDAEVATTLAGVVGFTNAVPVTRDTDVFVRLNDGASRDALLLGVDARAGVLGEAGRREIQRLEDEFGSDPRALRTSVLVSDTLRDEL